MHVAAQCSCYAPWPTKTRQTDRQTDRRTDTSPMHVGFPRDTASVNSVTCLSWPQRVEQSTKGTRRAELGNALGRHERTRRRIIVVLYQQVPLSALIPPPCLSSPPPLSASMFVCLSLWVRRRICSPYWTDTIFRATYSRVVATATRASF